MKVIIIAVVAALVVCSLLLFGAVTARAEKPLEISNLKAGDLVVEGMELANRTAVRVDMAAARTGYGKGLFAYGWILDAGTRDLVWSADDIHDMDRISEVIYECRDTVTLRPGKYEIYYFVGEQNQFFAGDFDVDIRGLDELFDVIGDLMKDAESKQRKFNEEDAEELFFRISPQGAVTYFKPLFPEPAGAVFSQLRPKSNSYFSEGFSLSQKTALKVYAIGEYASQYEVFVDGGWIINADTRERVWNMDKWNTEWAGGADKNRVCRDQVTLPAGNYIAYYATDDSHDPSHWNSPPPADPMNFGMTILAATPVDAKNITGFDDAQREAPIVRMVRIRDSQSEKTGFTLKKEARLRVVALGERSYSDDELADRAWIVDAETMKKVWEMEADQCTYAGGASKNCLFDGFVTLPAGSYIVYYKSDDSHAYGDWNAAPPFDQDSWGISIYGAGKGFSADIFTIDDNAAPAGKVVVDMTQLGDDEELSRRFTLDRTTTLTVTALGEGRSNEMYDYGWIEDKRGEVIWEMTYRRTKPAGGADKNRIIIDRLTLDKGVYTVHFVTDDSHSYDDFNAAPPDDPELWGILITEK